MSREAIQKCLCFCIRELLAIRDDAEGRQYSHDELIASAKLWEEYDRLAALLPNYPQPNYEVLIELEQKNKSESEALETAQETHCQIDEDSWQPI